MFHKMFRKMIPLSLLLISLIMATAACQPIQPVNAAAPDSKAVVQGFYEGVVNQHHPERLKDIFTADMVDHELGTGPFIKDTELFAAMPDMHIQVNQWVIEGNMVAANVTVTGTHKGALAGVPPTNAQITWSQMDIWRIKDGKIAEVWHNFPTKDILQQVGYQLVPPAK